VQEREQLLQVQQHRPPFLALPGILEVRFDNPESQLLADNQPRSLALDLHHLEQQLDPVEALRHPLGIYQCS
jgi:hypothetical protein